MTVNDVKKQPSAARPASLMEAGYERLHRDIVQGEVLPKQRLVETDLMVTLNVSRAVVRTILARLENDGLVVREPNRGAHVRMVSEAEALEITQARAALESLAAQGAAINATEEDLLQLKDMVTQMRGFLDSGDLLKYSDVNSRLHAKVIAASGNATADRLIKALKAQLVRFQFRTVLVAGRAKKSILEHTEIVDAIVARDPVRAAAAMTAHLSHVAEALKETAGAQPQQNSDDAAPTP